jgi:hypothetical protein
MFARRLERTNPPDAGADKIGDREVAMAEMKRFADQAV